MTTEKIDLTDATRILERNGSGRDACIRILQDIQSKYGYLPMRVLAHVAENTEITERQLYGVATFYDQFSFVPPGKYLVRVCHGTACHVNGAAKITEAIERFLGVEEGETSDDGLFTLKSVACLGCCSLAPVMMVGETVHGRLTPDSACKVLEKYKEKEKLQK